MALQRVQDANRFIVGAAIDQRLRVFKPAQLLLFRWSLLGAPASSVGWWLGATLQHTTWIPCQSVLGKNIKTETLQHLYLLVILFLLYVQNATKPCTIFSTHTEKKIKHDDKKSSWNFREMAIGCASLRHGFTLLPPPKYKKKIIFSQSVHFC